MRSVIIEIKCQYPLLCDMFILKIILFCKLNTHTFVF